MTSRESTPLVVWYGRLTSARRLLARSTALVGPGLVWLVVFLVLPSFVLGAVAFASRDAYGRIEWEFSLASFERLLGFGATGGWTADYLRIFGRSIEVAAITTLVAILLAYPLAFFIAACPRRWRFVALAIVVVPMCTNLVVRTYAWEFLFARDMPPAAFARWLGFLDPGEGLYPGLFAVVVGMTANALPFAVLPLYTSVERMDGSLLDAARDLYSNGWRVFVHAILPQTRAALSVAVILTFVPAVGMFVLTDRLGGGKFLLVGNLIQQQFSTARDFPFGAAVSLVLVALTLAGLYFYRRSAARVEIL